ncbi:MAG: biotin synthase BioB [Bacteroidota bacterium]|nr:biotin synthase BioB [Bacteroidota bacterium]MDP4231630.1 biotin synthase BioB [Bacteroidota bacterium]MDP4236423.1 biotin synthase BioB [Bacteroidota bacterium]
MISFEDVRKLFTSPFLQLVSQANEVHQKYHRFADIQLCTLLSIKTGGCPEDCAYCPQAARYDTGVDAQKLLDVDFVVSTATKAKDAGATRFCMGAAWREVRDGRDFDQVLEMVSKVNDLGLEVCTTLGMITDAQAKRLKEAGLSAYNHNLDTSESYYGKIIRTREYQDRLDTLENVRQAGISVCCGGILGMGETDDDRINFLHTLANFDPQPESVPINALVPVEGTPLADAPPLDPFDFIRVIACARILMPRARVRLSAGRLSLSQEAQALAFLAGANSIFTGDTLLTTPNPAFNEDAALLKKLGVKPKAPFAMEMSLAE